MPNHPRKPEGTMFTKEQLLEEQRHSNIVHGYFDTPLMEDYLKALDMIKVFQTGIKNGIVGRWIWEAIEKEKESE